MAAIALSLGISPQVTPINAMLMWWKREQWQVQFLLDVYFGTNITIKSVKELRILDLSLRLCPDWTSTSKSELRSRGGID